MLLNAAKFQDYSFYRFGVIKGKPTGGYKPDLLFNSTPVHQTHCQKHLGVCLDMKLNFKGKMLKAMKRIGITKMQINVLPRNILITIYKSFVKLHPNYCDLIYGQPSNERFW